MFFLSVRTPLCNPSQLPLGVTDNNASNDRRPKDVLNGKGGDLKDTAASDLEAEGAPVCIGQLLHHIKTDDTGRVEGSSLFGDGRGVELSLQERCKS